MLRSLVAALGVCGTLASSSQAVVYIDRYVDEFAVSARGDTSPQTETQTNIAGVAGGNRAIHIATTGTSGYGVFSNSGFLTLVTGADVRSGEITITYGGAGDLNLDLTGQTQFELPIVAEDFTGSFGNALELGLSLTSGRGTPNVTTREVSSLMSAATLGTRRNAMPLSLFAPLGAGVNLADVDAITMRLTLRGGSPDVLFGPLAAVPEPTSLGALAVAGVALARRRVRA